MSCSRHKSMTESELRTIIHAAREYERGHRFRVSVEVEAMAFAKAVVHLADLAEAEARKRSDT